MNNSVLRPKLTPRRPEPPDDHTIRWFLVRWTVVFILLAFLGYFITQNITLLLTGTLIWLVASYVYAFYFAKK